MGTVAVLAVAAIRLDHRHKAQGRVEAEHHRHKAQGRVEAEHHLLKGLDRFEDLFTEKYCIPMYASTIVYYNLWKWAADYG